MISLLVILLYFVVSAVLVCGYWVYDLGVDEIEARFVSAKLSLLGQHESQSFTPAMMNATTVPVDDPLEAWMLQASDAERRYYALHMLHEDIVESKLPTTPTRRSVLDYVKREMYRVRDEAEQNIESRLELTRREQDFSELWIIEDPMLNYKRHVEFSMERSLREEPDEMLERQMTVTAQNILHEATHEI